MIAIFISALLFFQPAADLPVADSRSVLPAAPQPVENIEAADTPNDAGGSIDISWDPSPDEDKIVLYELYRATSPDGPYEKLVEYKLPTFSYSDLDVENSQPYFYRVDVLDAYGQRSSAAATGEVVARAQWFNTFRIPILVFALIYGGLVILYIEFAKKDTEMFIRRIAGLDAIDDAVGRATEMGKPILYSFGIGYLTDVATLASLSILRRVSRRAAQYETRLLVPHYDPIVMTAAQETVKQSFTEVGRPDLYNDGDITFLTQDQFGYAAGVDGIMIREQPGTVFLQGVFYAEALILAETAHSVGAISIAGTDRATQLPFFIAACDYTLIGEELFAASAYLDRDPQMLGSLKSEDVAKIITVGVIILVSLVGTVGSVLTSILPEAPFTQSVNSLFDALRAFLTTS